MCFGGKGGGGHQGGGSSQEDAEVRRSHSKAGISAAETRRYFREKENPAHSRNENAPGGTTSVSHSRDEGGNLVAKQVEYGQGSFAPPQGEREGRMKAENILGKRNDVNQIGNDLDIGGTIFKNARLSKSGNSILSTDPNSIGTIGGITSNGGLWGGNKIKSVLGVTDGVGAVNSRGIGTSLVTPVLDNQRRSRTAKYQAQSDLFKNSTPAEIEAIRAANRKKNPADRDGDGSWLTSTDDMGRIAGIGSRGDGSGAQPYIFDPTLGKDYQALPQLDPNRGADTNLTTFGKFMRKAGGPIVANMMGPAAPIAGAMLLANKYPDKVPSFLTGRGTYSPAYDEPIGPNLPTRFATSDQNAPNPFSETSSTSTLGSALSRIQSPYPQKRPTVNAGSPVFDRSETSLKNRGTANAGSPVFDRSETSLKNRGIANAGSPVFDRSVEDLKNMGTSTIGALSAFDEAKTPEFYDMFGDSEFQTTAERAKMSDVQPNSLFNKIDELKYLEGEKYTANTRDMIDKLYGSRIGQRNLSNEETGSPSRFVNYAFNESGSDDNDSENVNNGVPIQPVIAPSADYAQWMPNSEYIGASSYGGPFSSASQNFASVLPPSIYSTGGSSNSVPTRFVNDRTKQYFTAPNDSYYAEENSDWRQANPYSLA